MDFKLLLTAMWTGAGTLAYLLEPRFGPFFLPLALIAPLLWRDRRGDLARPLMKMSALSWVLALASAYLLINATWSLEPGHASIAVFIFCVLSIVLHILARTLPELEASPLRAMALGFYGGYILSALISSIEVIFDHPLHLRLFRTFPALMPQMRELVFVDNVLQKLPSFFLNHSIAGLSFLVWPALLTAWYLAVSARARSILLAGFLPIIPAVYLSDHETSKVALVGGVAAFLVSRLLPRATNGLMVSTWLIACTAALPLASLAYDLQLYRAEWLQSSARHRIVIWGTTSQRAGEAIVFGHGVATARHIGKVEEFPVYAPGTSFPLSVGPHAHNAFLQVWFDTGAFGAVLLLMIGLLTLRVISRLAANLQPALYATYATAALLAASTSSLWTRSFLASFGICAVYAILAWSFANSVLAETSAARRP